MKTNMRRAIPHRAFCGILVRKFFMAHHQRREFHYVGELEYGEKPRFYGDGRGTPYHGEG